MAKTKLSQAEQVIIDRARSSLAVYLGLVHMTDDGSQAIPPSHLRKYVIPAIQNDALGHTLIVAPPGSIKTNTMIGACAWWLGRNPNEHVAYICSTGPKAAERSLVIRDLVERHGTYRQTFPNVEPDKTRGWAQDSWYLKRKNMTDKNPSLLAIGVGGAILGARIHRAILDDIADDDNMKTDLQRKQLKQWLEQTFLTRLDDPSLGRAIMICTRWHQDDPANWAMEQGWHTIVLPALIDNEGSYWPERWPTERLDCKGDHNAGEKCWFNPNKQAWEQCMKRQLGADGFAKQYMGVVTNDETALFKRFNWRTYKDLPKEGRGAIFIDLAHDEKTTSDFTVIAAIKTDGIRRYWERLVRRRMQFPEVVLAAKEMRAAFPFYPIVVEDVSNSKPLIQTLQRELGNVMAWKLEGKSKLARAESASPSHEAGDWFLPENAGWKGDLIEEHAQFPFGKNDDMVDISSMQHLYFAKRVRAPKPPRAKDAPTFAREWAKLRA